MGQQSHSYSKQTIEQMKTYYKNQLEKAPAHSIFRARTANAVITAYSSGKVLFQGEDPGAEAKKWDTKADPFAESEKKTSHSSNEIPADFFTKSHIGSDESGTGDYFGPITTCAVYVKEDKIALLKEIGIQDSKAISDKKIKELSTYLIEMNIPYSLMILHNEKYNRLQQRGWSQGKMKAMLHDACIKSVLEKIGDAPLEGILIDQFCMPHIYKKHIASEDQVLDKNTYFMTKAENYSIAVAAGSIIARASFVNEMDRLSHFVGTDLLKGASAKVDQLAGRIIREKGEGILNKIAKVHFANTEKARGWR